MQPGEVDDGVLEETDIVEAVRGMRGWGWGVSTGPFGIRAEELKGWLQKATREKTGNALVGRGVAANSVGVCEG